MEMVVGVVEGGGDTVGGVEGGREKDCIVVVEGEDKVVDMCEEDLMGGSEFGFDGRCIGFTEEISVSIVGSDTAEVATGM